MKIQEAFRMLMRALISIAALAWAGAFIWKISFPKEGSAEFLEIILGFVLGTLITTIINFYLGGNENETKNSAPTVPDYSTHGMRSTGLEISTGHDASGKSSVDD